MQHRQLLNKQQAFLYISAQSWRVPLRPSHGDWAQLCPAPPPPPVLPLPQLWMTLRSWSMSSLTSIWRKAWTLASERRTCCRNCRRWLTVEGYVEHNQHPAPTSHPRLCLVTLYLKEVKTITHFLFKKNAFSPLKVQLILSFRFIFVVLYVLDIFSLFSFPAHMMA